jgi:hypothetical protein
MYYSPRIHSEKDAGMNSPLDLTRAQWAYVLHAIECPERPLDGHPGAPYPESLEAIAVSLRESLAPEDLLTLRQSHAGKVLDTATYAQLQAIVEQSMREAGDREPAQWHGRFKLAAAS